MIIAVTNKSNFEDKLVSILDTAKLKGENAITVMTDRAWHKEIYDFMCNHKAIKKIKLGGCTFFVIKEMRVELKPIDFYI